VANTGCMSFAKKDVQFFVFAEHAPENRYCLGIGPQQMIRKEIEMSVSTRKSTLTRSALLLFLVVITTLCIGIANFQAAHATTGSVTVALTIVDENGTAMKNQTYTLDDGKTVADLLAAAGFTAGTQAQSATSPSTCYYDSYGYPAFKGLAYDAVSGKYWASFYDGASAVAETALATTLVDAKHYQYYYTTFATTAFDYAALSLTDPMPTTPEPKPAEVNKYDADKTAALLASLTDKFSSFEIDGETYEAAMALNSLGTGNAINAESIIEAIAAEIETNNLLTSPGRLSKYILALTAGGVDCTKVTVAGKECNLVKEMQDNVKDYLEQPYSYYGFATIIAVYHYGSYALEGSDEALDELIKGLLASNMDGILGFDIALTSEAVNALLPYKTRSDVAAFLLEAKDALMAYLQGNGAIDDYSWGENDYPDYTSKAICALAALGVDVANDKNLITENGSSPLGFIVNKASNGANPDMAEGKVLLALAAAKNFQEGGYNVFDFTALPSPDTPEGDLPKAGDTTPMLPLTIIASLSLLAIAAKAGLQRTARR